MVFALTFRSFTSTLLPQRTMGMFSQTRTKSPAFVSFVTPERLVDERTVPVWYIFVGDTRRHVKHDDATLAVDVVSITETAKLLLTCSIPHVKLDGTQVLCYVSLRCIRTLAVGQGSAHRRKAERVDFDTKSSNVFLLEFSGKMTLDECGL